MNFKSEHPNGQSGEKRKALRVNEKQIVAILLTDDGLTEKGYKRGERLEVEIGEVAPDELGAVLLREGHWYVGYISAQPSGLEIANAPHGERSVYFSASEITKWGRVRRPRRNTVVTNIWAVSSQQTQGQPVMTWQTDAHGTVTRANQACREFLGLTIEEMRAGKWQAHIHPDDRDAYINSRERAIMESETYDNTIRVRNAHGEYVTLSIILAPFWEQGRVTGWQAIARVIEGKIKRSA